MSNSYTYRKRIRHRHHKTLRRRAIMAMLILIAFIGGVVFVFLDMIKAEDSATPVSKAEQIEITDQINTFQSPYFKFSDRGNWVFSKVDSEDKKLVYYKYRGKNIEHILTVYVDQTPINLYLSASRVLPVRLVNNNRLDVTNVSKPCGSEYGQPPPRPVKVVEIENSKMLCDPDIPHYSVQLAEIGGNWDLQMRHSSGKPVNFIILYRDMTRNSGSDTIRQIASTFEAL